MPQVGGEPGVTQMAEVSFWRFMLPVLWGPGLFVALGLMVYGVAAGFKRSDDALRADPVRAVAQVVAADRIAPQGQRQPRYDLTLRVPSAEGGFDYTTSVPQPIYDLARTAPTVDIWQQRDNPRNLRFVADWDPTRPGADPRWWGAAPLAVAAAILGALIWARLPAWRAFSGGDTYVATITRHRSLGRRRGAHSVEWIGQNGRPQVWKATRRRPLPPVGSTIPVVIDPETGREFRADQI